MPFEVEVLAFGSSHNGHVDQDEFQFFSVQIPTTAARFRVQVIRETSEYGLSDPDVFLSFTEEHPDEETSSWVLDDRESEEKIITRASSDFCTIEPCLLYITVYGFYGCDFELGVFDAPATAVEAAEDVELTFGESSDFTLWEGSVLHFNVSVPRSAQALQIELVPWRGDPDLFVSFTMPRPDARSARWVMDSVDAEERVFTRAGDGFCAGEAEAEGACTLFGTAYADSDSSFSLAVFAAQPSDAEDEEPPDSRTDDAEERELRLGEWALGSVGSDEVAFFHAAVPPDVERLRLRLLPLSGDPDASLSFAHRHPGRHNAAWRLEGEGSEELQLRRGHPAFCAGGEPCQLHLALEGFSASRFWLAVFAQRSEGAAPPAPSSGAGPPGDGPPLPELALALGETHTLEPFEGETLHFALALPPDIAMADVQLRALRGQPLVLLSTNAPRPDGGSAELALALDEPGPRSALLRRSDGVFCVREPCVLHVTLLAPGGALLELRVSDAGPEEAPECGPGCSRAMVGDRHCDKACLTPACDFDRHDCAEGRPTPSLLPSPSPSPSPLPSPSPSPSPSPAAAPAAVAPVSEAAPASASLPPGTSGGAAGESPAAGLAAAHAAPGSGGAAAPGGGSSLASKATEPPPMSQAVPLAGLAITLLLLGAVWMWRRSKAKGSRAHNFQTIHSAKDRDEELEMAEPAAH